MAPWAGHATAPPTFIHAIDSIHDAPMKNLQDDLVSHGLGEALAALLVRFRQGHLSAEMTLMYWLMLGHRVEEVDACLEGLENAALSGCSTATSSFASLRTLLAANREGCQRIADMLASGVDSDRPASSVEEGIAFCRRLFDWSVQQSPEASVALYSLGNPVLLAAATEEIVACCGATMCWARNAMRSRSAAASAASRRRCRRRCAR